MDAWMHAMRNGDFAGAWLISDRVLRERRASAAAQFNLPRHLQHLWDGSPIEGKRVLVHCYHGLGDTIQFVRLLPLLRARAREVILWAQPVLLDLLRDCPGIDRLEPLHDGAPQIERDADVELMELAHLLRLTLAKIPTRMPYLRVRRVAIPRRDSRKRVGLVWRAGDWDAARSIPASALAPLRSLHDVRWVSLQFAARDCPLPAVDLACADLREQAQRMQNLDLIISVDTLAAHLAGALGLRTWLLLPQPCDWRWMTQRADSPWYPTLQLFRQHEQGDWSGVIEQVRTALATWIDLPKEDSDAQPYDTRLAAG
jgi:hypothetical protein